MDKHHLPRTFLATLERRDWGAFAAVLHPDVVYEIPQSRERIRGRGTYVRFNRELPGDWHIVPRVIVADDLGGAAWFDWRVADDAADDLGGAAWFDWRVADDAADGVVFFAFENDLISHVTDFWPEPYDPPPGREHLVERW